MGAMTTLPVREEGWTVEDLDGLPDDGLRYELVDGSLLVSPPPTVGHNAAAFELGVLLRAAVGDSWRVVPAPGVRLDLRNYREPDLVVVRREAIGARLADACDVLLAVEVMSPSSVTDDRVTKPAQYARAGIPHYWRLERGGVPVLVTHELAGGVYRETGRFVDEVVVDRPVAVRFRLDAVLR
jgi:Uma2 family endonuclease